MGIETWAATIDTVVIGAVEHDFMSLSRQTDDLLSATQQFAEAETGRCRSQRDARGAEEVSDWHSDWLKCGRQGLLGLRVPEQYEGQQKDVATTVAALEAFGRGCSDNGLSLALNGQIWAVQEPIQSFGSDAQKAKYLPGLASGKLVGAHGMARTQ